MRENDQKWEDVVKNVRSENSEFVLVVKEKIKKVANSYLILL